MNRVVKQDLHAIRPLRMEAPPHDDDDDDSIDLRAIFGKLWRGKWIIAVTTLITWIIGVLAASEYQPVYQATSKVMFNLERTNIVDVEELVVSAGVNENTIQNQIEILKSDALIERVVAKLKLLENPEFNPALRAPREPTLIENVQGVIAIPPELTDFLQDFGIIEPPPPPAPAPSEDEQASIDRRIVIESLSQRLALRPVQGTRVIEITFFSGNPRTAAAVVNGVAQQYIVDQLDAKLEATRAATDWLSERVEELRERVQAGEQTVEMARERLSEESGQSPEVTQQQLQAGNASLGELRNQVRVAQAIFDRVSLAVAENRDFGAIPEFRASDVISGFRREVATLEAEAAQMGPGNPRLIRIQSQIDELQSQMQAEAERILEALRTDLDGKLQRRDILANEVEVLEAQAQQQSREQVEIRQLEREADASRTLYQNFLARLEETSAQQDLQSADARILSSADPPLQPLVQAKQRTILLAIVAGLLGGIGIVFLLDKLNNTFRSPGQMEEMTGEAVLGTIPSVGRRFHKTDVLRQFEEHPKASLAESIRSLRTSILFSNVDTPPHVVMFTSSVPREGKSTTSILTAMTSRQMGKSAVIVDCDLRLPALARLLKVDDDTPGLLSLLEGSATLDEALFVDKTTGLDVLMTKPSEPRSNLNAADILASNKFHELVAQLRQRYDLVILDTPPVLVVADARILSRHADAAVYIVRWDSTPRGAVLEGLKELRSVNAPLAGMVLTQINEERAMRYAYEGYSYYKGQYKDYYVD